MSQSEHLVLHPDSSVAVVGTGSIGLLALKETLEYFSSQVPNGSSHVGTGSSVSNRFTGPQLQNLRKRVVGFERAASVGGVWRSSRTPFGNAYDSLHTNSSKLMMQISDFPWSRVEENPDLGTFPSREEVCKYYQGYSDYHHLENFILFHTEVLKVEFKTAGSLPQSPSQAKRYRITYRMHHPSGGSSLHAKEFDIVFCCSGQYSSRSVPNIPGVSSFGAFMCHSHDYRNPDTVLMAAAKQHSHHTATTVLRPKVVVVGVGNSALDIALELCNAGAEVIISYRSPPMIIPVADSNKSPLDVKLLTRFYQQSLPRSIRGAHFFYWLLRDINKAFRAGGLPSVDKRVPGIQVKFSNLKEHELWKRLLKSGHVSFRPHVTQLGARRVGFADQSEVSGVDAIIFCTGYHLEFPYLSKSMPDFEDKVLRSYHVGRSTVRWANLYRRILSPRHPGLVFLGMFSSLGNETCVGEMQARWAIAALTGNTQTPLPSADAMAEECERIQRKKEGQHAAFPTFIAYTRYMDWLASDLGCKPTASWWRDPVLWWNLWVGPLVPAQYRLDSDPSARQRVVSRL